MNRRKTRTTARKSDRVVARPDAAAADSSDAKPAANCPAAEARLTPRDKWFLAAAIALEAFWIGLLILLAIKG